MTDTMTKLMLSTPLMLKIIVTRIISQSIGTVMWTNCWIREAPSSSAASYKSGGIPSMPAM
ncbi:hypothetical protein D3C73_1330820 [compost metagenome]